MDRLPTVVASTVVRSAHQGESHGGVYIVDLETGAVEQVIDYDAPSISWEGRGGPRGLRGIAIYGDEIYLAASNEIFVYSREFDLLRSIESPYLAHCHETHLAGDTLYVTSTGRDSVLEYDLRARRFVRGYNIWFEGPTRYFNMMGYRRSVSRFAPMPRMRAFDPNADGGPSGWSNTCHLNNVFAEDGRLFASGTRCAHLLSIEDSRLSSHARIVYGTHNARPFRDGVLLNDTRGDRVSYVDRDARAISVNVKKYDEQKLLNTGLPEDHARQGFARGLCLLGGDLIAGGSSPSTVSVYDLGEASTLKTINLTMDVRNTIHGLEVWPF